MEKFLERMETIKTILKIIIGVEVSAGGVAIGLDILVKPINTGVLTSVLNAVKQVTATGSNLGIITVLSIAILILALKK